MSLLQKVGLAAAASLAMGCAENTQVKELTPEDQELVNTLVQDAKASEGVIKYLVDHSRTLFDAQGEEGETEQLKVDIETLTENLEDFDEQGKIFEFDSRELSQEVLEGHTADSVAFHHYNSLKGQSLEDNYIALDVADRELWSPGILAHEIGHLYGGHSQAIKEAVDNDASNTELLKLTLEKHDFSYLLSALYTVSDATLAQYKFDVENNAHYVQDEFEAGRMTAAQAETEIEARLAFDTRDWLLAESPEIYQNYADQLTVLGINELDMTQALSDATFLARLESLRSEARQEILREVHQELNQEPHHEITAHWRPR